MKHIGLRFFGILIFISTTSLLALSVCNTEAEDKNFAMRGRLSTSYDDNVTFAHTRVVADVLQTMLVGLDLKNEGSRNNLLVQADLSQNFYLNNSSFNNTAVLFRGRDIYEVSERMRLNIADSYDRAEEPSSFDDAFGRSSGRYRTDRNKLSLGLDFDVNSHTIFEWTYRNEWTGYSRKDLDNSTLNQTGGHLGYMLDDVNSIGIGYEYGLRGYETGSNITDHTLLADFSHNFTKQLKLVLKVGEDFIANKTTGSSHQARYEVSLLNDIDETTNAVLSYRRGLSSYDFSRDLFDSYQLSGALRRELTQRVSVNGVAFYGQGEYQQSKIHDKLMGTGGGVNYELSEQVSVGLNYSFSKTISNQDTRSYQRNFVGFQIEMKF